MFEVNFLYFFVCLFVSLSTFQSVCLSLCLPFSLSLCLFLSIFKRSWMVPNLPSKWRGVRTFSYIWNVLGSFFVINCFVCLCVCFFLSFFLLNNFITTKKQPTNKGKFTYRLRKNKIYEPIKKQLTVLFSWKKDWLNTQFVLLVNYSIWLSKFLLLSSQ